VKEKSPVFRETARLAIGELIVSALVIAVYALVQKTVRWQVPVSALIGSAVMVANFFFLAKSTDALFMQAMEARGNKEMTEEEIAKFTAEYQLKMATKTQISFIIRMISMAATIALTFIFLEGIAATVPLLMQRPLLYVNEFFRKKEDKAS
jgi:hypothetical protein